MTHATRATAGGLGLACLLLGGLACALEGGRACALEGGRDVAAGLRGLAAIRGAAMGAAVVLPLADYAAGERAGALGNPGLTETSGLTASLREDDLFWAVNDSGTAPRLYAVGGDGRDRGFARVEEGAPAVDWEDVTAFRHEDRTYLLVADTGDNLSWRERVELFAVLEPVLAGEALAASAMAKVEWRIPFKFEDGPRDTEAIAIDVENERVLLISKRTEPPGLYELPLLPEAVAAAARDDEGRLTARRIGSLPGIPPPTQGDTQVSRLLARYVAMPTALDISPDGRRAAVLTYREAYLWRRARGETWEAAFARPPERIPTPALAQAESIAFGRDGRTLYVTSEGRNAPLFRLVPAQAGAAAD